MFHCLVINVRCVCLSDSSFTLSHSFLFVKNFFHFFESSFSKQFLKWCAAHRSDLYILSQGFLFVNNYFCFFQNILNCLFTRNNFLRQLNKNTTFFQPCQHPFLFFLKIFRIPAWESWFIKLKQTAGEEYSYCMGDAWCPVNHVVRNHFQADHTKSISLVVAFCFLMYSSFSHPPRNVHSSLRFAAGSHASRASCGSAANQDKVRCKLG